MEFDDTELFNKSCKNQWGSCNSYASDCKEEWFAPYVKYCPVTCNKCPTPVKPKCNAKDTAPTNIC